VVFPKGIVGTFEAVAARWRKQPAAKPAVLSPEMESAQ
jgi:hypothetical protein